MNLTLFDLDGTLIARDSDHAFGQFMVRLGWADGDTFRQRNDTFFRQYQAGALDLSAYVDFATSAWRDRPPAQALQARERFMREVIEPLVTPRAQALVEGHRAAGDLLAIVTATNEFVTTPIAEAFGIDDLIAVRLERDAEGRVTGRVRGTPSYREGKTLRVDEWLAGRGLTRVDFERITVYSDSINDLPLLEGASHPVATNPTPALDAIARERGWRILRLFDQ